MKEITKLDLQIRNALKEDGTEIYDMISSNSRRTLQQVLFVIEHDKSIFKVAVRKESIIGKPTYYVLQFIFFFNC